MRAPHVVRWRGHLAASRAFGRLPLRDRKRGAHAVLLEVHALRLPAATDGRAVVLVPHVPSHAVELVVHSGKARTRHAPHARHEDLWPDEHRCDGRELALSDQGHILRIRCTLGRKVGVGTFSAMPVLDVALRIQRVKALCFLQEVVEVLVNALQGVDGPQFLNVELLHEVLAYSVHLILRLFAEEVRQEEQGNDEEIERLQCEALHVPLQVQSVPKGGDLQPHAGGL
mmetsp:Transcript_111647/g.360407  ORF Transcript_111647/g.360407 Transcript_111647/m.360407 type:complete len:228 (-) Transcript_111647:147-830(-)